MIYTILEICQIVIIQKDIITNLYNKNIIIIII